MVLYVPAGRQKHNNKLDELLSQDPKEPINPTPSEAISHRMLTKVGKAFYALKKQQLNLLLELLKR